MTVDEVCAKYPDTDKGTIHSYTGVYEKLFLPRKLTAAKVLEVGVRGGGSLLAWRDYFPAAEVFGVDNGSEAGVWQSSDPRVTVMVADSHRPETLHAAAGGRGPFDVIIDDGCHHPYSQVATFAALRGYLAPGGVYVIEDVEDISYAVKMASLFGGEVYDLRGVKKRHDDILVVFGG